MLSLGAIGFAAPWALLGLLTLPGIWWLLRATPPSPKTMAFPAVRILRELKRTPESPARSPWWLTALRLFAAAALVFGLADPRFEPDPAPPGAGPVLVAIDNGWASGAHWPAMRDAAQRVIDRAERADRAVILLPTAPEVDASPPALTPALPARQAADRLRALNPQPWPVDRAAAAEALRAATPEGSTAAYWIADGLDAPGSDALGAALNAAGPLVIEEPAQAAPRTALIRAGGDAEGLSFTLRRPSAGGDAGPAAMARLVATDAEGRGLAAVEAVFADGAAETTARLEAPRGLRNRIARVAIDGEASAAAVALADDGWSRRAAGVVVTGGAEEARPLLSETYYITRALEPETDVVRGDVPALIAAGVGLIILPDAASVSTQDQLALLSFARDGGGILRFAGPRLADAAAAGESDADPLLPLRLRRSNRVLGGAMSWSEPAELAPFDADSPLAGLPTPREARVRQQLLAQPGADLNDRAWARLEDGTPLVTARDEGEGFLALAHVTADPRWSDLPLTAGYVGMLRRLAALGGGRASAPMGRNAFAPDTVLDGFGRAVPPGPAARAFGAEPPPVGPRRPPGLYTSGGVQLAVDLGPAVSAEPLRFLPRIPGAERRQGFAGESGARLGGALLAAALIALLIDALASLHLRGLLMRGGAVAALALAAIATPPPAQANTDEELIAAATRTRLAWLATSDARSDEIAQAGLAGLTTVLGRRTAVEAAEPRAVDAASDPLSLFPLIYWRLTPAQTGLSAQAAKALNAYLTNGGQLLIDLADGATSDTLLRLSGGLDAPPLAPVPPDHVLTRAFYLLQDFPGRRPGGQIWADRDKAANRDGVSSMIVASADFSGAWAVGPTGQPAFPVSPGGERQRELAYRFGVNVVLYALTGNYKADQVHVPAILDRLGQ